MNLIQKAIDEHGVKAVYHATVERMKGNEKSLDDVGLKAPDLASTWAIMSQAYGQMTASEKAGEHWDAQRELRDHAN